MADSQPYVPPRQQTNLTPTQRFVATVIAEAGSPARLASDMAKLGYVGRDGAYSPRSIRTWRSGGRMPGADLMFALARYYHVSLDEFAREGQ